MTDPRDLIQRLADALHNAIRVVNHEDGTQHIDTAQPVLAEARAYLATPEPVEGPTDEKLMQMAEDAGFVYIHDGQMFSSYCDSDDISQEVTAYARAVLSRYVHQPPQPIPLSAREFLEPEWVKQEDQTRKTTDGAQLIDGEWWAPCSDLFSMQRILDNARAVLARDGHSPT